MAALDTHEQEQIEAIKAWWNDNSRWLLGVFLIAALSMAGWRGWHYYKNNQAQEAATLFHQFSEQLGRGDAKLVNDAAAALMDKFPSTVYATRAALMAALVSEELKNLESAKKQLYWIIEHATEDTMRDIAHLRLAAILLDEKNFADALMHLDAKHTASFDGLYSDLKGDVLNAQGQSDSARTAYKLAYEKFDAQSSYRNLIQMKLDSLGLAK